MPDPISLTKARQKRKRRMDLWIAMDTMLDTLRAVVVLPLRDGKTAITFSAKQISRILALDEVYRKRLREDA